ncbi:MAG: hypothetical protein SNF68_02240 [Rikenellaceae bacterium]
MFTININGKANPQNSQMVKLEMIFFKTGYARVTKVLNIAGWEIRKQLGNIGLNL